MLDEYGSLGRLLPELRAEFDRQWTQLIDSRQALSALKDGTRRRASLQVDLQRKSRNVRARDNALTL
jgi:hypothetical protein